jgi:hypothetical protein
VGPPVVRPQHLNNRFADAVKLYYTKLVSFFEKCCSKLPLYLAGNKYAERQAVWGRLVCDLNISAKELLRCKSYDLGALVEKCLGEGEEDKRSLLTPDSLRFVSPAPFFHIMDQVKVLYSE